MRLLRDFALIVLPFGVLSAFFFIGEVPKMGFFCVGLTLMALWYVRPRRQDPAPISPDDEPPLQRPIDKRPDAGSSAWGG